MKISQAIGNFADIAVGPIDASQTIATTSAGGLSVFCGLVVSERGKPFELIRVTGANWREKLGNPPRPSAGLPAASLRCLNDALQGGDGYVVRVTPSTAKYPVLTASDVNVETGKNTTSATALAFNSKPVLQEGELLAIYPIDGDTSPRSIELTAIQDAEHEFNLRVYANDSVGNEYIANEWHVSSNINALDDDGRSLFITDVLERSSAQCRVVVSEKLDPSALVGISKTPFVGATSGNATEITQLEWEKGIAVLSSAMVEFTAVVSLGITDSAVIEKLVKVANDRRIDMFADVAADNWSGAVEAMKAAAYSSERLACYFFPYYAKDPFSDHRAHWGLSGIAFKAKAMGIAKAEGSVGGYHYSPAGVERGLINRKEVQPFEGLDEPDLEALYKVRLNRLDLAPNGTLMIGDALTTRVKEDYLRFQHVTSTVDAISRDFARLAKQVQHEPDEDTRSAIKRGLEDILDGYVAANALVSPRDPDQGEAPYVFEIKQVAIDFWEVTWWVCVTGSSRRILGKPVLFK
ncbi:hypothetical protein [Shewanella algae]|uniref:hypothetical protein n=1 Tax=Shewanella algae TaxID=38313 RepID=UPI0031F577C0